MKQPEPTSEQWRQALWNRYRSAAGVTLPALSDYAAALELAEKARFLQNCGLLKTNAETSSRLPAEPMEQRLFTLFGD